MDTWTDKETRKQRSKLKVVGEGMQLLGSPGGGNNQGGGYNQGGQQNAPMQQAPQQVQQPPAQGGSPASNMPDFHDEDDDIPF